MNELSERNCKKSVPLLLALLIVIVVYLQPSYWNWVNSAKSIDVNLSHNIGLIFVMGISGIVIIFFLYNVWYYYNLKNKGE